VALVYLFGSAADASVAEPRDIDLAVLTDPALSFEERLALRAELVAAGTPGVDLVSLNEASIVLSREVAEHGVCLFARTSDDEIDFVTRARARFWDFQPYLAEQWKLAGERAEGRRHGAQT
jgi:predicted nucleotidyltransferase